MPGPEHAYWAALLLFGVPCAVVARRVVPMLAIAIVLINGVTWRLGLTGTAEGWLLAVLYVAAFGAAFGRRMVRCGAEAFSAAMWWPMALAALWQATGGDEYAAYWAIYWLAMTQAATFLFMGGWPARIARGLYARGDRQHRGMQRCPA